MEGNFETFDTIEESPYLLYDNNQYTDEKIKDLIINKNINKIETNKCKNTISEDNNKTKYEDIILMQRENRKIISEIKKIISNKESTDPNMKILLIKEVLNNFKRKISLLYDDKNDTLLHIYVKKNDIKSLNIILNVYSDILHFSEDFYNFLLLKNIEDKTVFDLCIENNYIPIIKLLFSKIENENNYKEKNKYMNYFKNNIFHKCAEYNQYYMTLFFYEKLRKFYKLFTLQQILNINNKDKMNPMHIASKKGNKKVLNLLLDLGGDINSKDINGFTPLHYAVISGNEKIAKKLILRGANKFKKDLNNRTPYDLAVSMNKKNLINLLHHKHFCRRKFCGDEIEPMVKTKNHCFLLIGIIFTILLKLTIIERFIYLLYNINFNIFNVLSSNNQISNLIDESFFYLNKFGINYKHNSTISNEINLNDFFNCIDKGCDLEIGIIFCSLITDFFLLFTIIIFKCSKSVFLKKYTEKECDSLTELCENNEYICVKCRISINKKTKHCFICQRCVNNWDHHCYWLNSCINDKNYGKFKLFLFSILIFLIFDLVFYSISLYLFLNSKDLEEIFNLAKGTLFFYIIKITFFLIFIYILIIIVYSLIFITFPLIRNFCISSNDEKENEVKLDLFMNITDNNDINV